MRVLFHLFVSQITGLGSLPYAWLRSMHPCAGAAPSCCTELCTPSCYAQGMEPACEGCGEGEERRWDLGITVDRGITVDLGITVDRVMGGAQHCFVFASTDTLYAFSALASCDVSPRPCFTLSACRQEPGGITASDRLAKMRCR